MSTPKIGFQQCNVKNSCQQDFVIRHNCNSKKDKYHSLLGTKRNDLGPGSPDTWTCSMHSKDSFTVSLMGTLCSSAKRENSSTFDNEVSVEVPGYHENTNLYHSSHHLYHSFISQENPLKSNTQILRKLDSRFALEHRYSAVAMNNCLVFGAFLLMIYSNDLVWDFAGESIGLLVTSCVIGTCGFSTSRLFDM